MAVEILFSDNHLVAAAKPAGLATVPDETGDPSLLDEVREWIRVTAGKPGNVFVGVVHRLDRPVSGLVLFARTSKAASRLAAAWRTRTVEKIYLGIVAGPVAEDEGTIALSLSKISSAEKGWRMIAAKKGKPAVTHWRKLATRGGLTLVEFRPETGRTHQIRVHAEHGLGNALLGDPVYGDGKGAPRTMLHARALAIPREGKPPVAALAPLPDDFRALGFGDADLGA